MFRVIGNIIEYDGKPFAVVTSRLSGFRMEAVDALNLHTTMTHDDADEMLKEVRGDVNQNINEMLTEAVEGIWLPETFRDEIAKRCEVVVTAAFEQIKRAWIKPE